MFARQAVPLLIELMRDTVPQVKDMAAWCMSRICELHTPSISDDNKMQVAMNALVLGLADHAKVARWCVGGINVLAERVLDETEVRRRCLDGNAPLCV
jgi:importin subunit beta-1